MSAQARFRLSRKDLLVEEVELRSRLGRTRSEIKHKWTTSVWATLEVEFVRSTESFGAFGIGSSQCFRSSRPHVVRELWIGTAY